MRLRWFKKATGPPYPFARKLLKQSQPKPMRNFFRGNNSQGAMVRTPDLSLGFGCLGGKFLAVGFLAPVVLGDWSCEASAPIARLNSYLASGPKP